MGQLNSCCCGCTLAQGTVGTGIYVSISAIYSIVQGVVMLQYSKDSYYEQYIDSKYLRSMGISTIVLASLALLVSQVLFVAVATQRKQFLLPWLIFYVLVFASSAISLILVMSYGALNAAFTISSLIGLVIMIYLYMVVVSYYKSFDRPAGGVVLNPGVTVQPPLVYGQQQYSGYSAPVQPYQVQPPLVYGQQQYSGYSAPVQPYQAPPYSGPTDRKF